MLTLQQHLKQNIVKCLPALAGIVQGVVVQIAKHKFGKNSSSKPPEVGAWSNLKFAYMLFETCPSGYCIGVLKYLKKENVKGKTGGKNKQTNRRIDTIRNQHTLLLVCQGYTGCNSLRKNDESFLIEKDELNPTGHRTSFSFPQ